MNEQVGIPKKTARRLPQYLSYLKELHQDGVEFVSASRISEIFDVQHTQVRKDIALTGAQGVPRVGHNVFNLIKKIESFLGWDRSLDVLLVGTGNIGKALVGYPGFHNAGSISIRCLLDSDPKKIGSRIYGHIVQDVKNLRQIILKHEIQIGIIATPAPSAQEIANEMTQSGVKAIWNFAPTHLQVDESVIVENFDMYSSLGILSRRLKEKMNLGDLR